MRRGYVLCVGWSKIKSHAMFLLVSLPVYNAPDALWKTLCVVPRTSDLLLSAKQRKNEPAALFTITATLLKTRFLTHTMHMLLLHSGTLTAWISLGVLVLIINVAVMEAVFSIFPQITESSLIGKQQKAKDKKVNITSSLNPFQRKWDFPYFSMFFLDPSSGEETMADFSFPGDLYTFPKLGEKNWWEWTSFKKASADYLIITSVPMSTF